MCGTPRLAVASILAALFPLTVLAGHETYQQAYEAAQAKIRAKDYAGARADLAEAVKLAQSPKDRASAQFRIAETYETEKNYEKTREAIQKVLTWKDVRPADKYYALYKIGTTHYAEKDYATAAEVYLKARDVETLTPAYKTRAYTYLAYTYQRQKDHVKLRRVCADILKIEGLSVGYRADAQYMIAESYYADRDFVRAKQEYEKVREVDPKGERYGESRITSKTKSCEREHEKQLLATRGHPFYESKAQFNAAYEPYLDREYPTAREELAEVVAMPGAHRDYRAQAQLLIGYTHFVEQTYDKARTAYARVLSMPDIPDTYKSQAAYYIGRTHFNSGQAKEAEEALRKAITFKDESGRVPRQSDIDGFLKKIAAGSLIPESKDRRPTGQEQEAQRLIVLQRMAKEGLSEENCYLKGQRIGTSSSTHYWPFPKDSFPYNWDFEDGTLCGINQVGPGIANARVEDGKLKFRVTGKDAHLSWGNFDMTKPALRFGYGSGHGDLSPRLGYVEIRIRQTAKVSIWVVGNKYTRKGKAKERYSGDLTIKGTEWQTAVLKHDGA